MSDTAWARLARLIVPKHPSGGRPCPAERWREYANAILYVVRTGCPRRALPHDFGVRWSATHKHFLRRCRTGVWQRILRSLREETRRHGGRRTKPTGAVIDSSSVKGTPVRGPRGFDGAKKIDGIKRHIAVDTGGLLLAAHVTPASVQDRAAFAALIRKTKRSCSTVQHAWLGGGYTGQTVAQAAERHGVSIEIVGGPKAPSGGFRVQPRRWVVERSNGWINHNRRLVRQYATTADAHEGFLVLSQIVLLLRRLDRGQLFDTL